MKIIDAFIEAGIKVPGIAIATDQIFKTTCSTCGAPQQLKKFSNSEDITYYHCKDGCENPIAMVYRYGSINNHAGHAYRLKNYVVKSYSDLFIVMPNGALIQFPK